MGVECWLLVKIPWARRYGKRMRYQMVRTVQQVLRNLRTGEGPQHISKPASQKDLSSNAWSIISAAQISESGNTNQLLALPTHTKAFEIAILKALRKHHYHIAAVATCETEPADAQSLERAAANSSR